MEQIKVEEIANELGMKSRELISRIGELSEEALFSLNIKSGSSNIDVKTAEEIFDAIMHDRDLSGMVSTPIFKNIDNIHFSFVHSPIDIEFIKKVASIYKTQSTEHFMVRSFNFSEMDIVRFFTAGLIDLDVARYINKRSSKEELDRLLNNLNEILDDVEVENIDKQDPFHDLESYVEKHKPEVIYIEGLDVQKSNRYRKEFQYIRKLCSTSKTRVEISFVNLPMTDADKIIENIISMFSNNTTDKEHTIDTIQKCVPIILENEKYLESYIDHLSNKYGFKAQKEHLCRKLNSFLSASFRKDPVKLGQRLVRGEYEDKTAETWIWLSSHEVAMIAKTVIKDF